MVFRASISNDTTYFATNTKSLEEQMIWENVVWIDCTSIQLNLPLCSFEFRNLCKARRTNKKCLAVVSILIMIRNFI